MSLAQVITLYDRSEKVAVNRWSLRAAAENAVGASLSVQDAVDTAINAVWSGDRATTIRQLERIGFENSARLPHLLILTKASEDATPCPDGRTGSPHGRAA